MRYTPEVHEFIRGNVQGRTAAELAELTNEAFGTGFTASSMKAYKNNHKLRSGTPTGLPKGRATDLYPADVRDFIQANYRGTSYAAMAALLKKTFGREYTTRQIMGYYKNHKLDSGLTGRFEKGNIPPNKGKKGWCAPGTEKGHFRKGHVPDNKLPIGTVQEKADGYLWKKIGDGARDWRQLHIILWEEANGPLPEGYVLIFRDGNKHNCDLENLVPASKAENAVMNRNKLRFSTPEHTDAGLLIAKIKIAARRKRRQYQ